MERETAWKKYDKAALAELETLAADYIDFISDNKTERECAAAAIAAAEDAGTDNNNSIRIIGAGAAISGCFISLIALLSGGETLVPLTTGIVLTVLGGLIFLTTKNK